MNRLTDAGWTASVLPRVLAATPNTGRFRGLILEADGTLVAMLEAPDQTLRTVVCSHGFWVVEPLALDADERSRLPDELFGLTDDDLITLPDLIVDALEDAEPGSTVDRVLFLAIGRPPHIELRLAHPHHIQESVRYTLSG